jgi:hypothetical protein
MSERDRRIASRTTGSFERVATASTGATAPSKYPPPPAHLATSS